MFYSIAWDLDYVTYKIFKDTSNASSIKLKSPTIINMVIMRTMDIHLFFKPKMFFKLNSKNSHEHIQDILNYVFAESNEMEM